jgi:hypothetical protein
LSTLIITSALAIGDTVDYSVKSGVFDGLGGIDEQISATSVESAAGFGFGSNGPAADVSSAGSEWFAASIAAEAAELVGPSTADGCVGDDGHDQAQQYKQGDQEVIGGNSEDVFHEYISSRVYL